MHASQPLVLPFLSSDRHLCFRERYCRVQLAACRGSSGCALPYCRSIPLSYSVLSARVRMYRGAIVFCEARRLDTAREGSEVVPRGRCKDWEHVFCLGLPPKLRFSRCSASLSFCGDVGPRTTIAPTVRADGAPLRYFRPCSPRGSGPFLVRRGLSPPVEARQARARAYSVPTGW